jgi:hypothetical protein
MKEVDLLNTVIIAHVVFLLDKEEETRKYWPDWLIKHHGWCRRYLRSRKYPDEFTATLDAIDSDILYNEAKEKEISYVVMILELMKIWVESGVPLPAFSVSKKYLKGGRKHIATGMLKKKLHDPEDYAEKKALVEDSVTAARYLWGAFNRHILKGNYPYKEDKQ